MLAPILVFTYNRVDHFIKTIESLKKSELAGDSVLVVISDGPKDKQAVKNVLKIREYAAKIEGFQSVELLFRETNWGVYRSFKAAKTDYLNKFGKIIFMEDDNVVHPMLLTFLNEALNFYENDKNVFSISGYSIPVNFNSSNGFYFLPWFVPWVCATWKNKYYKFDWDVNLFGENNAEKGNRRKIKSIGRFFYESAYLDYKGYSHAMDARVNMYLFNKKMVTVCPIKSLVHNIGNDGTGVNAGGTNRFDTNLDHKIIYPFNFHLFEKLDNDILLKQKIFLDRGLIYKFINALYIRRLYYVFKFYYSYLKRFINLRKILNAIIFYCQPF
jgi:hypothetical protein